MMRSMVLTNDVWWVSTDKRWVAGFFLRQDGELVLADVSVGLRISCTMSHARSSLFLYSVRAGVWSS